MTHSSRGRSRARATFGGVLAAVLLVVPLAAGRAAAPDTEQALQAVLDGPQRTPAFKQRDKYRHPLQTLEFLGIRPDMTVVEVLPGGGWYTEILAPFLRDHGKLLEATPVVSSANPYYRRTATAFAAKLAAAPDVYGKVGITPFEPPDYMPLGAPGSADMVVTFLNLHDFVYVNVHKEILDDIVQRFFRAALQVLRPGGRLGVVEHRAKAGMGLAESLPLGRLPQDYVIQQARRAGLTLIETSEATANPRDDGSNPVWNLPPMLKLGEQDRSKYLEIGESDNMTLLFAAPKE